MAGAVMQPVSQPVEYAGFFERFLAVLIDAVILSIASAVIRMVLGSIVGALIGLALGIAYEVYFLSSPKQATIGKQAMGIIVTDLNGGRIDPGKAALRWVGKIISCIILFIGYIMAAFTERKQALHDMIAGTLVLKGKR
jgi:uncharacterized RDD family membrane protein YckC